jgi:ribosomal protein L20
MRYKLTLLLLLVFRSVACLADEGMWLPQLLQALNEKQMKKLGMKINASDIYNINKSSLKDAIVSFGGFCTAEVISDKGLLLTNHHCGFDAIQNHSSVEKNYIQNGFWAYDFKQELPNAGLTATFIVRIDDVTDQILKETTTGMDEKARQAKIDQNLAALKKSAARESHQDVLIRSFFDGNKYFLFVTETYKDVRLVGAPPSSIGNYGKDSDNWMWPRHTGDFSLFRIYADKNNRPAAYSPDNVPYQPKRSLTISIKGLKEGDFTMVFGFPGRTNEYLSAAAVAQIMEQSDPVKIGIRAKALELLNGYMRKDEAIRIQYAAKYAGIENAYKKWQGEILGLTRSNALQRKRDYEATFLQRVNANVNWKESYGNLLTDLEKQYADIKRYALARDVYSEVMPKVEVFNVAATLKNLLAAWDKDSSTYVKKQAETIEALQEQFKEIHPKVDQHLFAALMAQYRQVQDPAFVAPAIQTAMEPFQQTEAWAAQLYNQTQLLHTDSLKAWIQLPVSELKLRLNADPGWAVYQAMSNHFAKEVSPTLNSIQANINKLQRSYMQAQMDVFKEKSFYPDANSTLRVTYGNVKGYRSRDAVKYDYYTYMEGIMEKYKPGDYEFDLPQKLIDLYRKKDFGPYAVNGRQPVCFIASNHTTGGNSGSPALDAYGNLVGLNFDRVWEGTMSDINYNPDICRNIMADIRYILFIIDKFADAQNIIRELKIVGKPVKK